MDIRKATPADLPAVLQVYSTARSFMAANGNPGQWAGGYPAQSLVEQDIRQGKCYVCVGEDQHIAGVFYFAVEEDPTYKVIKEGNWLNSRPYGVIHRIASDGSQRGVLSHCVHWCLDQWNTIRIDTHHDNSVMQRALAKLGFTQCGIIHVEDGSPRIAYQKCV